jgi:hypothetical protein
VIFSFLDPTVSQRSHRLAPTKQTRVRCAYARNGLHSLPMARSPITIRLSPVYEYGLARIAEREGVPMGSLLRRIIEEWAQAHTRAQAAEVSEHMRTSEEGIALTEFADAGLDDVLNFEERAASATQHASA